jgi:hypothetical protein
MQIQNYLGHNTKCFVFHLPNLLPAQNIVYPRYLVNEERYELSVTVFYKVKELIETLLVIL